MSINNSIVTVKNWNTDLYKNIYKCTFHINNVISLGKQLIKWLWFLIKLLLLYSCSWKRHKASYSSVLLSWLIIDIPCNDTCWWVMSNPLFSISAFLCGICSKTVIISIDWYPSTNCDVFYIFLFYQELYFCCVFILFYFLSL